MEPECIVLDEATAMLDPVGRREVLSAVHRLNREKGITVVLITHHMNEAEDADRTDTASTTSDPHVQRGHALPAQRGGGHEL
ncbi:Energy-coupling factor transporter ATP-binding protein EcfA1 [uncultured Blautia sp.]|nr:Energy-coupling factor transporter ATP-binding protein EcfA1 [uncultured Blautia sp.]